MPINLASNHLTARQHRIYRRSFMVSLWVGTLLNCINQPQIISTILLADVEGLNKINILKIILTYLVPFAVFCYSAISALAGFTNTEN
jgi:hypothetical protein